MFNKKFVGEVYNNCGYDGCSYTGHGHSNWRFDRFEEKDITDHIGNKIKIKGQWFNTNKVFFYDNIYDPIRNNIRKAQEKEFDKLMELD